MFEVHSGVGIQYIGTATAERLDEFQPQIMEFITKNASCEP